MTRLLLFSGSQAPLAVRYPRPEQPTLTLPPLIHRSLHSALDSTPPSALYDTGSDALVIPQPGTLSKHALAPEDYEVTVKVQVPGGAAPVQAIEEALNAVAEYKGLSAVDVVLVGLPSGASAQEWVDVWRTLSSGQVGNVKHWGTMNLDEDRLAQLCDIGPPYVNEISLPDNGMLPKVLAEFAKVKGILLWAGGDGAGCDPLPAAELHNLLNEFQPTLSKLLPSAQKAPLIPVAQDGKSYSDAQPSVSVQWVLMYNVVSRTRNIVKDKGYIISAAFA